MPPHIEFALSFLIELSGITQPRADRRLNGIENTIADLARRWRVAAPLNAVEELRMCAETTRALLAWIEAERTADAPTRARLTVYRSGAVNDEAVPVGWVRLQLRVGGV